MIRRAMTPARKRRIHTRENGLCWHCKQPVPMFGPDVRYDHVIGVWLTERDEDEDVKPAHTSCDAPKTAADQTRIAKTKRQAWKNDPAERAPRQAKKRPIPNRGFQKPTAKRPWPKRKMQGRGK